MKGRKGDRERKGDEAKGMFHYIVVRKIYFIL